MDAKPGFGLKKCNKKKCTKELKNITEINKQFYTDITNLVIKKLQKKITEQEFKKKFKTIVDTHFESPQLKALAKCSLDNCNKELKAAFKSMSDSLDSICNKQKRQCNEAKENKDILKEPITLDSYIQFMKNIIPK